MPIFNAVDFLRGGVNSIINKTLSAPFSYVKLRLQLQDVDEQLNHGKPPRYKGIIDCATRVASGKDGGVLEFYRGHVASCFRYFPSQLTTFLFKDLKQLFPVYDRDTEFAKFVIADICSRTLTWVCNNVILFPYDYVCKMRTIRGIEGRSIDYEGNVSSLYTGFECGLAGIVAWGLLSHINFDIIKTLNPLKEDTGTLARILTFLVGKIPLIIRYTAVFPFETVQRRMQFQQCLSKETDKEEKTYETSYDCARKIVSEEGVQGLYKGLGMSILVSGWNVVALLALKSAAKSLVFDGK